MNDLMDYEETAALTKIKKSTLYAMVSKKLIPHIRIGGRSVRFSRAEIMSWLESCRVPSEKLEVKDEL